MTSRWPGLALAGALGLVATALGAAAPVIGGPVIGIVLGVAGRELIARRRPAAAIAVTPGARVASKLVLQTAVVLLGFGLSLAQVARTGRDTMPVMLGTLAVALVGAALLGRALGINGETTMLVGVGTGICGASAIATTSAVIGASEVAIATSVTTIFLFNATAAVVFPLVGHALGLSQDAFGLWAGTAINDTSSVVAAGTVYGSTALAAAVVVKLTRTLMIVPVSVALAVRTHRRELAAGQAVDGRPVDGQLAAGQLVDGQPVAGQPVDREGADDGAPRTSGGLPWRRLVPPFLVLFLVAAGVRSLGLVPDGWQPGIAWTAKLFTAVALAGVGLLTPVEGLRRAGWRPLALGGALWIAVALSSLALQAATGRL